MSLPDQVEAPEADALEPEPPAPAAPAPGEQLRLERMRQGLSVADIAQRLKYAPRQVEALESGEHAALPGLTFERGFVRGYAKLLGIDAAPLVAELERQADQGSGPTTVQLQSISAGQGQFPASVSSHVSAWPWLLAILIVVAGVGGYSIYHWSPPESLTRSDRQPTPVPPAPPQIAPAPGPADAATQGSVLAEGTTAQGTIALTPPGIAATQAPEAAVPATAPAPPAVAAGTGLRLVFAGESWTEVRDASGKVVFSRKSVAGTEHVVEGQAPFDLVIGNARDVKVFYRGAEVDLAPYIKVSVARLQLK